MSETPGDRLVTELICMLVSEKTLHEQMRYPLDRTQTVDRAIKYLREEDPASVHHAYVVWALQRITGPDRVQEEDYWLEESLLQRLTAEDWFAQQR